jgi:hypothetical protein
LSRLRILLALAAVSALATVLAACGGNGDASPQAVVDSATLQGIQSANVDARIHVKASGKEGGDLDVSLSGPFQSQEGSDLPQLDMTAKATGAINGKDINFDGGLVLLPNSAYVNYQGTEYEVDPTTFSFVESTVRQAQQKGSEGQPAGATACQGALGELSVGSFVDNLSNEGSADVKGTQTTKISGDLNVSGAIDSLIEVSEDPACKSQLNAAGSLPSASKLQEAKDELKSAVKTGHVDLYVGDDDIVRRISADVVVEPTKGSGPSKADVSFDLTLSGVNEDQEISPPSGAKPLNDLFQKLGVNPIELLGALQGEGNGLGNLLEGLGEGSSGGSEGGGEGGGGQQAYLKCLQNARTPVDLQHCASLL